MACPGQSLRTSSPSFKDSFSLATAVLGKYRLRCEIWRFFSRESGCNCSASSGEVGVLRESMQFSSKHGCEFDCELELDFDPVRKRE